MELHQVVLQVLCILPRCFRHKDWRIVSDSCGDCVMSLKRVSLSQGPKQHSSPSNEQYYSLRVLGKSGFPRLEASDKVHFCRLSLSIGVATSAYQIEGAWNVSDKGISTWDVFTRKNPSPIADGSNGDVACDFYNRYKEDITLAKNIGVDFYRLSLSWARILPTGYSNKISKDGIQYYKNVIDELRSQGIEPYVTIYHWDHPAVLDDIGGWTNELMVEYFADYARVVFKELGNKIKFWITINEINPYCYMAYGGTALAPGLGLSQRGAYLCTHNMLKAHARAYHIYDDEFRAIQKGKIGVTTHCYHGYAADENDLESSKIAFDFDCGWVAHPIFSIEGDYPKIMKLRIDENSRAEGLSHSKLPQFSDHWIRYIKGSSDYFGLNHYTSFMVESVPKINGTYWQNDSGLNIFQNTDWPTTSLEICRIKPDGLRQLLKRIKETYGNPQIYMLENGATLTKGIEDHDRISFLYSYIKQVFLASQVDGVDIKSYTIWSLMDNFQWMDGYRIPYGLVHIDFNHPNLTRTMRLSGKWLTDVMKRRELLMFNGTNLYENF